MSETQTPSTDISAEILAAANATQEPAPHVDPPPQPLPPLDRPAVEESFDYSGKVYGPHKKLIDSGTHPRDIAHLKWGRWKGCQCLDCKAARNEIHKATGAQSINPDPATDAFKDLIDEEIAAAILNTPNRMGEIFCRVKKLPKEALEVWDVPEKELKVYGRLGKRISDLYITLPDFKHKELFLLGIYEGSQFSMRVATTLLILKTTQEEKK